MKNCMFRRTACYEELHVTKNCMFRRTACYEELHVPKNCMFRRTACSEELHVTKNCMFTEYCMLRSAMLYRVLRAAECVGPHCCSDADDMCLPQSGCHHHVANAKMISDHPAARGKAERFACVNKMVNAQLDLPQLQVGLSENSLRPTHARSDKRANLCARPIPQPCSGR
jgi:hypothetical protein